MSEETNTESKPTNSRYAERLKFWKQARAARKPKNRSSKHLRAITPDKDICRCLSNEALKAMANNDNFNARQELNRRDAHRDRKEIRDARRASKLAEKKAAKNG